MSGRRFLLPVVLSATFVQLLSVTIAQIAAPVTGDCSRWVQWFSKSARRLVPPLPAPGG